MQARADGNEFTGTCIYLLGTTWMSLQQGKEEDLVRLLRWPPELIKTHPSLTQSQNLKRTGESRKVSPPINIGKNDIGEEESLEKDHTQ